jgi:UDP-N-acetylmuramate dehydrogenase
MDLASRTTLRLGGPAARLVEAHTEAEIVAGVAEADATGEELLLLAGGSNVVVADAGFPGLVVAIASRGIGRAEDGERVVLSVQAGEDWDTLVAQTIDEEIAGIECLSGIPGSVGATPIQNVGAYGQDVAQTVVGVRAYDRHAREVVELDPAACAFSYRSSAFKREPGRWVVLEVAFAFDVERGSKSKPIRYAELAGKLDVGVGGRAPLVEVREAVLALRRAKGMVLDSGDPDSVSAGSFFTNPILTAKELRTLEGRILEHLGPDVRMPRYLEADGRFKTSAAWLIEHAGFRKGHGDPATIAISSKHPLALTNRGAGTTLQLVALARELAEGVEAAFGISLVPEPVFVGHTWPGHAAR